VAECARLYCVNYEAAVSGSIAQAAAKLTEELFRKAEPAGKNAGRELCNWAKIANEETSPPLIPVG